jgi:hypothetical protein
MKLSYDLTVDVERDREVKRDALYAGEFAEAPNFRLVLPQE